MSKQIEKLIFIVIITLTVSCNQENNSQKLAWMSDISNVKISKDIKNLTVFDGYEWGIIVKFKLANHNFDLFIEENQMKPVMDVRNVSITLLNDIEELPLGSIFIKDKRNYLHYSDCKTHNSWYLLANKKTKEIWFEVLSPDLQGDDPYCDK